MPSQPILIREAECVLLGGGAEATGPADILIENGRIAEIWNHRDDLSVLQQIGAVTLPA
jgi:dihydroorotase-like cyclic amidohydrolase